MFVDERAMIAHINGGNEAKFTPRSLQMRMDRAIRRSVVAALERSPRLPNGTVWVSVKNGWVTLRGHVDWESDRAAAILLTRDQVGVRGVTNLLIVMRSSHP